MRLFHIVTSITVASIFLAGCAPQRMQPLPENPPVNAEPPNLPINNPLAPEKAEGAQSKAPAQKSRTVRVDIASWSFSPAKIQAKVGEKVNLELHGISGTHGFTIPALNINQPIIANQTKTIVLPTKTAGTFDGFCSIPCGSGHRDMRFQVIITP